MTDRPAPPSGPAGLGPDGAPGPDTDDAEPMSFGRRAARITALVVAVAIAGLWAYALWGPTKKDPPGLLSDHSWAVTAQGICTDAAAALAVLPPAYESKGNTARAEVIDEANGSLAIMVERLTQGAPSADSGDDGRMIQEGLGDWRTYLGDRERYVVALEDDPDARFLVSEKDKRQITEPIDFFAKYNEMENCMTPGDLA